MKAHQISALTHKTLSKAWEKLRNRHNELNGFRSLEQLVEEFGGFRHGPFRYVLTRIDPDLNFEPANVRLERIEDDGDLAGLPWPYL